MQAHSCRQCQRRYPEKRHSHRWVPKFNENGTSWKLNAKSRRDACSGRQRSVRSPVKTDDVRDFVGLKIVLMSET